MPYPRIITGVVVSYSGVTLTARLLGNAGEPIVQADVSSIAYTVRDLTAGSTTTASTALTPVSAYVYNSLQLDNPRWDVDSIHVPGPDRRYGYNFLATLGASLFTAFDVEA